MSRFIPSVIRQSHGLQRFMLLLGFAIIAIFLFVAIFAPWLAPYGFNDDRSGGVVFGTQQAPSAAHWFGTTVGGTDVLSRVIYGTRTAIEVILLAVILSSLVGVPLGLISGYLGGWLDRILVLVMDALYAFPSLLLAIVVSIVLVGGASGASEASWPRRSRSRSSSCRSTTASSATRPCRSRQSPTSTRRRSSGCEPHGSCASTSSPTSRPRCR